MYYDNDDMSFSGEASVLLMALAVRVLVVPRLVRRTGLKVLAYSTRLISHENFPTDGDLKESDRRPALEIELSENAVYRSPTMLCTYERDEIDASGMLEETMERLIELRRQSAMTGHLRDCC